MIQQKHHIDYNMDRDKNCEVFQYCHIILANNYMEMTKRLLVLVLLRAYRTKRCSGVQSIAKTRTHYC
jgi:hypothetical protein